ncbi:hypothetical protein J2792_002909 [Novosphingobium capsulatum]|uniref:Uncharacterized protein n=1 Tax=Novosphingobium capsulatum TaxID=13688 RepID=A0ABU1MNU2_9SPHN|nr:MULTISPECIES: hypothetical protein [Novosphingobium]MDR6512026.1 hypothetical protein [Novosphingobium capsulatum]WQD91486.1 hypothetical protein U0041_10705 [Novosphingobium capsulatum]
MRDRSRSIAPEIEMAASRSAWASAFHTRKVTISTEVSTERLISTVSNAA